MIFCLYPEGVSYQSPGSRFAHPWVIEPQFNLPRRPEGVTSIKSPGTRPMEPRWGRIWVWTGFPACAKRDPGL